jgi:hypothetical protein
VRPQLLEGGAFADAGQGPADGFRRELLARDHSDPGRCFAVVFFDSYESAMENSNLPETQASAEQFAKMSDTAPLFYDLDILEDRP